MQKILRNEGPASLQAKVKALRERQRARLDARHHYMLEMVAERLELAVNVVEEFMLDSDQVRIGPNTLTSQHCPPSLPPVKPV